jgi:hypothetical protein
MSRMASNAAATTALLLTWQNCSGFRPSQPIVERTATHPQTAAYGGPAHGAVAPDRSRKPKRVGQGRAAPLACSSMELFEFFVAVG